MRVEEYRLVVAGWFLLILLLTIFWYATLRRLSKVLKEHLRATRSSQPVPGFLGLALFILRGEYRQTGDDRLIGVCRRLRNLLYGYLGSIGAYIVFLVIMRPRF